MKKKILSLMIALLMILLLSACGNLLPRSGNTQTLDTEINKIVEVDEAWNPKDFNEKNMDTAMSDFAVRLLQNELSCVKCPVGSSGNCLLSPFSVLTALSMTANGADGETLTQMEETLGISREALNQYFSSYMQQLKQGESSKFHMANSIWYAAQYAEDYGFMLSEDFINEMKALYNADVFEASFQNETVDDINLWVEENTNGLIKEIINEIPADAVMYLANALVFDAKWEENYEETDIRKGTFTVPEGIEQEVDMMYSTESFYLEDEHATGFLKYYEGRDYAFVALLPNEDITLQEYVDAMSGEKLHTMLSEPEEVMVHAWLPQFQVEYQAELTEVLSQMGMKDLFDSDKANLSALGTSTEGNLFVDRVLHKTYMEVSPVGTKAGAATAVEVKNESAMMEPENVKEVCLDHPFLYLIIDCKNNQPIFMGTINYVAAYRCGTDDLCGYPTVD